MLYKVNLNENVIFNHELLIDIPVPEDDLHYILEGSKETGTIHEVIHDYGGKILEFDEDNYGILNDVKVNNIEEFL